MRTARAGRPETLVFAGCDAPIKRKLVTAEHVHGKTGLDGPQLAEPKMPLQDQHAVDFIIETALSTENDIRNLVYIKRIDRTKKYFDICQTLHLQ